MLFALLCRRQPALETTEQTTLYEGRLHAGSRINERGKRLKSFGTLPRFQLNTVLLKITSIRASELFILGPRDTQCDLADAIILRCQQHPYRPKQSDYYAAYNGPISEHIRLHAFAPVQY